jgi:hypothetical protein
VSTMPDTVSSPCSAPLLSLTRSGKPLRCSPRRRLRNRRDLKSRRLKPLRDSGCDSGSILISTVFADNPVLDGATRAPYMVCLGVIWRNSEAPVWRDRAQICRRSPNRHLELLRQIKPGVMNVDGNDGCGAGNARRHHRRESDGPRSGYRHKGASRRTQRAEDGSGSGLRLLLCTAMTLPTRNV